MAENKVQFGLKNVHYAVYDGTSWSTPVAVKGAVSLSLDQAGDLQRFYADDGVFYATVANQGYTGSLEMARISDAMLKDVWGLSLGDTSKVLTENVNVEAKPFALLYEIDGDKDAQRYVLYNCIATRPNAGSSTKSETADPQTQTINLTCMPIATGAVFARTTDATPTATYEGWFTAVFLNSGFAVLYDANGGTGTVEDSSSPYMNGATVTVLDDTGLTAPTGKQFSTWNTEADGSGTDYAPAATFTITAPTTLYAVWVDE